MAFGAIQSGLAESYKAEVSDCTHSKAAWDKLEEIHKRAGISKSLQILRNFHQMDPAGPGETMQEVINRIDDAASRLKDLTT